ncbi:MAG TPA: hypothetical protein VHC20_07340 [Candidatus Paceibacterota bacterium]|nr:hypothetical protein [Candidatus Paceibacterota bacterium]
MHHTLREIAKVAIGLFIADLFSVIWLGSYGFFPLTILGVTWPSDAILPIALFDIAVALLLAHYAWHTRAPLRSPSERTLLMIAGIIFLLVALAHLTRLAFGLGIALGDFAVPLWLSWVGVIITAYLSYSSFHFALRGRK